MSNSERLQRLIFMKRHEKSNNRTTTVVFSTSFDNDNSPAPRSILIPKISFFLIFSELILNKKRKSLRKFYSFVKA